MKRIFVVLDTDSGKALKAFVSENRANDYADDYYNRKGTDTRVDEVWFNDVED